MGLNRDAIRASRKDRKPVRLEVPEWGGDVFIRVLSAGESLDYTEDTTAQKMLFELIIGTLVGEDGEPIFTADDRQWLTEEPFKLIFDVFTACARVNGIPVGDLEEAVQNFEPAPDASSSTG